MYIRLLDGDHLGPVAEEWTAQGIEPIAGDPAESGGRLHLLRQLQEAGGSFVIDDLGRRDDLADTDWPDIRAKAGARAVVITPLAAGPELLGAVVLTKVGGARHWTPAELQLIENVAADTGRGFRLAQLYEAQAQLVEQLRELDRVKDEFVSMVSHELRTPLTSITGYVELLTDGAAGPLTDGQRHMLGVVARNTVQLRSLIEDLLTLSQIESGHYRLRRVPVEFGAIVEQACTAVRADPQTGELDFDYCLPGEPLVVVGDGNQLERVLLKLLNNAVKFTPAGGRVQVSALRRGDDAVLAVADTGMGVPADELDKLFTRFFRASNATYKAVQGTGLGLAIVRMIVEQHGGHVSINSVVDKGTTVMVRIPLAAANPAGADVLDAGGTAGNTAEPIGVEPAVPSSGTLVSGSGSRGAQESYDSAP